VATSICLTNAISREEQLARLIKQDLSSNLQSTLSLIFLPSSLYHYYQASGRS
jgi:hypothetical protein